MAIYLTRLYCHLFTYSLPYTSFPHLVLTVLSLKISLSGSFILFYFFSIYLDVLVIILFSRRSFSGFSDVSLMKMLYICCLVEFVRMFCHWGPDGLWIMNGSLPQKSLNFFFFFFFLNCNIEFICALFSWMTRKRTIYCLCVSISLLL